MTASFEAWLRAAAAGRAERGLTRSLTVRAADVIDLAGNDYLGLRRHPSVVDAAIRAARELGAGATGSRLVTGTTAAHVDLERELAEFFGTAAGLVFSSGYLANLGVLGGLGGPGVRVVSDAGNHASLIDGCRLSRSPVTVTPAGDLDAVRRALGARSEPRALLVVDGVSSIDGTIAPVAELHAIAREADAMLLVDEAHGVGVVGPGGRGAAALDGLGAEPDLIRTVTLSKALGGQGGAVVGPDVVVDHLVNTARTFIFDTGLSPMSAAAARAALAVLAADPGLADAVRERARLLAAAVGAPPPESAVVNVVLGEPTAAVAAAERCRAGGVQVGCFRPPSVPAGTSRLRLTARADLTDAEIERAARVVVDAVKQTG